jgi:hypothetical protein
MNAPGRYAVPGRCFLKETHMKHDSEVEITPQEIRDALKRPSDFGLSSHAEHYDEMFVTWSLGPVIRHRDSNLLQESNADALEAHLKEDPTLEDEWTITSCNHWAVGWVDHLSFHAVEEDGKTPTRMFRVLRAWFDALEDYPVADESDLSRREYEATLENVENVGRRFLKDGVPETWVGEVYDWLSKNEPREVEDRDGLGGYPNDKPMKAALKKLGYLDEEYDNE